MKRRLFDFNCHANYMHVSTIHSFCASVLRTEAASLDRNSNFSIYTEDEKKSLLKKVVKVTIPRPPNWISARITPCPKGVQKVPVSTTIKPVTQEAEVAVNRVVKKSVKVPERLQTGRVSTKAPANINRAKLETMTRAGLFKKFGLFFPKRFK